MTEILTIQNDIFRTTTSIDLIDNNFRGCGFCKVIDEKNNIRIITPKSIISAIEKADQNQN